MRLDKFTTKAQEALQDAHGIANERGQQQVDTLHLLKALLLQEESLVLAIVEKMSANNTKIEKEIDQALIKLPQIKIATAGLMQAFLTQDLGKTMERAFKEADKLKDEFVSTEHFLLAILITPNRAREILEGNGLDYDKVLKVLSEVRGGEQVTDMEPEAKYQVLEKYARNLTEMARQEKLDPVISRDNEIRRLMQVLSRRIKK